MRPIRALNAAAPMSPPRSPWHSPVPYLFGGLAAMLGLIAFALLILACSYWRLSGRREGGDDERDLENGNEKEGNLEKPSGKVYEEKVLVIMAGEDMPTFLATPVSGKNCCFDEKNGNNNVEKKQEEKVEEDKAEKSKEMEMISHDRRTTQTEEEEEETQLAPVQVINQ